MPTVDVIDLDNQVQGQIDLPEAIFGAEVKLHLLHEVVRWQLNKRRAGTHAAKARADVNFSTKKLYKQKGTGQARRGSRKAAGLRKGGTIHGPIPRDYGYVLPKKVRRAGLVSALSHKMAQGRVKVLASLALPEPKTKAFVAALDRIGVPGSALVVDAGSANFALSVRNIPRVDAMKPGGVNVYDLLNHDYLLIARDALPELVARFGAAGEAA